MECPTPYGLTIMYYTTNKRKVYNFLWIHFLSNFQYDNPCTYHFYTHVVDAPTHPAPLYCNSSISNVVQ